MEPLIVDLFKDAEYPRLTIGQTETNLPAPVLNYRMSGWLHQSRQTFDYLVSFTNVIAWLTASGIWEARELSYSRKRLASTRKRQPRVTLNGSSLELSILSNRSLIGIR